MKTETDSEEEGKQQRHQDDEMRYTKNKGQNEPSDPNDDDRSQRISKGRIADLLRNCVKQVNHEPLNTTKKYQSGSCKQLTLSKQPHAIAAAANTIAGREKVLWPITYRVPPVVLQGSHRGSAALSLLVLRDIVSRWGSRNSSNFISCDRLSVDNTGVLVGFLDGGIVVHFTTKQRNNDFVFAFFGALHGFSVHNAAKG